MAEKTKLANAMWLLVVVLAGLLLKYAASEPDAVQLVSRCSTVQTEDMFIREVYPIPESGIDNGKVTLKFQVKAETDIVVNIYPNKTMEDSAFHYEININRDNNRSEILRCMKFKVTCDTIGSTSQIFPLSPSKRYFFNVNISPGGYWAVTQDDDRTILEGVELNPVPIQSFSLHSKSSATWVFNCKEVNDDDETIDENGEGSPEVSLKNTLISRKADNPPATAAIQVDEIKGTILSMDDEKQELVAQLHLKLDWTDTRLKWNATSVFGHLTLITFPANEIWTPEIFKFKTFPQDIATNEAVSLDTHLQRRSVLVSNTGLVKWQFQVTPMLPCDYPDPTNAPSPSQKKRLVCSIHLGEVEGHRFLQLDGQYDLQKQSVSKKWNIVKASTTSEQLKDALGNEHSALHLQVQLEEATES